MHGNQHSKRPKNKEYIETQKQGETARIPKAQKR